MADQEQEDLAQSVSETEDELLKGAFEPKAVEPPAKEQPEAAKEPPPAEAPAGRMRDPATGQFRKAASTTAEQPAPSQGGEKPAEPPKEDEILPSWRAREINEERRQIQAENERLRVEHARMQAWFTQQQRAEQAKAQPQPELPDPVLDYPGFVKAMEARMEAKLAAERQQAAIDRFENNLQLTHMRHGPRFEKAYEALVLEGQRGNSALVQHLSSQANPGEAIVRWHTQNEVLRQVGNDPAKYAENLREQLLNDPEFLAQAAERARTVAMGGQQKPNTVVKLPPSLSKATGTTDSADTATDGSEAALFNYAMQQPRRR